MSALSENTLPLAVTNSQPVSVMDSVTICGGTQTQKQIVCLGLSNTFYLRGPKCIYKQPHVQTHQTKAFFEWSLAHRLQNLAQMPVTT